MHAPSSSFVTVVTSTYNRSKELRRAIESVRAQTFTNWEHCVVGDCTPDDSEEVVASFNDPRIRFYNLPEKSPEGAHGAIAKNYGIEEMSRSPYICYLDDDDAYRPNFLEVMTGYARTHPEAEVIYCRGGYLHKDTGKKVWGNPFQRWMHDFDREKLKKYNYINTNWVMHKKALTDRIGGWDPTTFFDDYELFLRMSEVTDFHYINKVMVDNYIDEEPFMKRLFTKGLRILKVGRHTPVR